LEPEALLLSIKTRSTVLLLDYVLVVYGIRILVKHIIRTGINDVRDAVHVGGNSPRKSEANELDEGA
jgi:hypothetical protein